jgi:hypothetical protein
LREQAGLDLVTVTPARGGESRSAFWVTDRAGTVSVLKIMPDAPPEAAGHLRALDAVLARLRDRGTRHHGCTPSATCPSWCTGSSSACPDRPWTAARVDRTARHSSGC